MMCVNLGFIFHSYFAVLGTKAADFITLGKVVHDDVPTNLI